MLSVGVARVSLPRRRGCMSYSTRLSDPATIAPKREYRAAAQSLEQIRLEQIRW